MTSGSFSKISCSVESETVLVGVSVTSTPGCVLHLNVSSAHACFVAAFGCCWRGVRQISLPCPCQETHLSASPIHHWQWSISHWQIQVLQNSHFFLTSLNLSCATNGVTVVSLELTASLRFFLRKWLSNIQILIPSLSDFYSFQ